MLIPVSSVTTESRKDIGITVRYLVEDQRLKGYTCSHHIHRKPHMYVHIYFDRPFRTYDLVESYQVRPTMQDDRSLVGKMVGIDNEFPPVTFRSSLDPP